MTKSTTRYALALLASLAAGVSTAATVGVTVAPGPVNVGQTFDVTVDVSGVTDLYGFGFDLGFDPTRVQLVSESEGAFLPLGGPTYHLAGTPDNMNGFVTSVGDTLLSAVPGVDGTGTLEQFVFNAIGSGSADFTLSSLALVDSAGNDITPAYDPSQVLGSVDVAGGGPAAVPEPGAVVLLALGTLTALMRRRAIP